MESGNNWVNIPGGLVDVGTGADGTVWGTNSVDGVYKYNGDNTWT